jgi:GNAT superfamily N-acetyltransferase
MNPPNADTLLIRPAGRPDVPLILSFIRELAEYERLTHAVSATQEQLEHALFGPRPAAEVLIASLGDTPAGFALFFHNFSTFLAKPGIYLEDLFVRPAMRGKGIGRKLLAQLAKIACERDCGRVEWAVLDWNEPAIGFYKSLGANPMLDWRIFRLTGEPLKKLADHR